MAIWVVGQGAKDISKYLSYCMYLPLHSCIHHNSLHVDRSSTENTDLDQFVKMSFVSNEGMIKWKMLALNLEIYMS